MSLGLPDQQLVSLSLGLPNQQLVSLSLGLSDQQLVSVFVGLSEQELASVFVLLCVPDAPASLVSLGILEQHSSSGEHLAYSGGNRNLPAARKTIVDDKSNGNEHI